MNGDAAPVLVPDRRLPSALGSRGLRQGVPTVRSAARAAEVLITRSAAARATSLCLLVGRVALETRRAAALTLEALRAPRLSGATINWQSHALISALLLREAGTDHTDADTVQRRAFAGLIAVSTDWCWDVWLTMRAPYPRVTAWDVLAPYVRDGDDAPKVLVERAAQRGGAP